MEKRLNIGIGPNPWWIVRAGPFKPTARPTSQPAKTGSSHHSVRDRRLRPTQSPSATNRSAHNPTTIPLDIGYKRDIFPAVKLFFFSFISPATEALVTATHHRLATVLSGHTSILSI
jgi:hypothetical protein